MARPGSTDDSSTPPPTFQEAFAAAKEQHSKESTDETVDDDEQAPPDEASTDDDEAEEDAPPTREGKAAPASAESAQPDKTKTDTTGLITDEEFAKLQTKHANDPAKLRGELEAAFTKKTQALAEQRRSTERLSRYVDVIDAFEADPEATIIALAKQQGLTITRPGETTDETPTDDGETTDAVDAVMGEFKEALGPELEYLADGLAPAITKLVERLTTKATEPLKKQTEGLLSKAAGDQTEIVMKAFGESHPDWKTHEDAMFELSQKLAPKGMTEIEYLDHLYKLATADAKAAAREKDIESQVAERVKKSIARMNKGAADTDTRTDATPERHVRPATPETPTFQEAYEAAKRGERWV
jgi:hypothetical protein